MVDVTLPPELATRLADLVDLCDGPATAHVRVVFIDERFIVTSDLDQVAAADEQAALDRLLESCNRLVVEQCRDFAVHAGVVAQHGAALALPAESGTGKSTLVAALVAAGWDYVSDEALVLDSRGVVRPYPKWLSLHRWSLERLGLALPGSDAAERAVRPAELGPVASTATTLRLRHIVLPERAAQTSLKPRARAQAAADLLRLSFNHYQDPTGRMRLAADVARGAATWTLALADPVEAVQVLQETLGSD